MAEEQIILEFVGQSNGLKEFLDGLEQGITEEVQAIQKANKELLTQDKNINKLTADTDKFVKSMTDLNKAVAGGALKQASDNTAKVATNINKATGETAKLTTQLRALREQLGRLDEGSAEFQKLSVEAAKLEDRIGDVSQRVRALSSDTFAIDALVDSARAVAGAFSIAQGAAALLGDENEDLQKALLKVQASLAILNGLQETSNFLTGQSAGKIAILNLAQKAYAVVTNGATIATRAFGLALGAIGITAVVAGIGYLISLMTDLGEETEKTAEKQKDLNKELQEFNTLTGQADITLRKYGLQAQTVNDVLAALSKNQSIAGFSVKLLGDAINQLQDELKERTLKDFAITFVGDTTTATQRFETWKNLTIEQIRQLQTQVDKLNKSFERNPGANIEFDPNAPNPVQQALDKFLNTKTSKEALTVPLEGKVDKVEVPEATGVEAGRKFGERFADGIKEPESIDAIIAAYQEIQNSIFEITAQRRRDELAADLSALNERREAELANKELTEAQRANIDAKYRAQEKQLRIRAFNQEKQANISQAIMNGALAVTKILASLPGGPLNPATIAAIALTGITTSAQVATITAQRPPAFKKGTKSAPGGMALVGEEGAELVHLPRGAKVIPHGETMKVLSGHPDTNEILSRFNIPVASPKISALKEDFAGFDFVKFEKILSRNRQESKVIFDKQGIVTIVSEEGSRRTYLGQRYSSR